MPVLAVLQKDHAPGRPPTRVRIPGVETLEVSVAEATPTVGKVSPTSETSITRLRGLGWDYVDNPLDLGGTFRGQWSGSLTYIVGDVVRAANGKTYRAVSQVVNAEPPGVAWTEVSLGTAASSPILSGDGAPPSSLGVDGQFYLDSGGRLYGPKTAGSWGSGFRIGETANYYSSLTWKSYDASSQANGSNLDFSVQETAVAGTFRVYRNGQRLINGVHFTELSTTAIRLVGITPKSGEAVEIEYGTTGTNRVVKSSDLSSQANGQTSTFTLPESALAGSVRVYRNGQRLLPGVSFTESSSTTVSLVGVTPAAGEAIEVEYATAPP